MTPLRAAVVGAGHLGRFHAQKYDGLPGVCLAAVVDVDDQRARRLAAPLGADALSDHRQLAERVDVASVVVPTPLHYAVTRDLLESGIHVLVEKPFTTTVDEGMDLIERSARCGRVLQVGHVERFNPVVQALLQRVDNPMFIDAQRIAPFKPRGIDVDVVLDLMIHDIDLVLRLVRSPVTRIDASGGAVLTGHVDIANARLQFANGCVANLTASRVAAKSARQWRVFQPDGYLSADLGNRTLTECGKTCDADGAVALQARQVDLSDADPLTEELRAFLSCVTDGQPPAVSGADGVRALETAAEVARCIGHRARLQ